MANDPKQKARAEVKRAQAKVERTKGTLDEAMAARRASFKRARAAGLSLAEIGEARLVLTDELIRDSLRREKRQASDTDQPGV